MSLGAPEPEMNHQEELKKIVREAHCNPNQLSRVLAQHFGVRSTEVGLLFRHEYFLKFLYPVELQAAGSIPLSGSSVAARTATSRRADVFNNFARVPHRSIFETIKLKDSEAPQPIQKLMSAPVFGSNGDVVGVLQVSRKGDTPHQAGADFTQADIEKLTHAAQIISPYLTKLYRPEPKPHPVTVKAQSDHTAELRLPTEAAS